MDLNEVPSDHMVIEVKMEERTVQNSDANCNGKMEDSKMKFSRVEQRCREVEEKCLALDLEIRNKDMELEAIKEKIRVLEGERVGIEEEVRVLREKKAVLVGTGVSEAVGGKIPLDGRNVEIECEEMSKLDQLMIENKVLECEKSFLLKELEEWKRKCKELESCVLESDGRLNRRDKDGVSAGMKDPPKDENDVLALRNFRSAMCSPGSADGGRQMEGTTSTGTPVKRQLSFRDEGIRDEKIAPPTPAGARPSSAVIDIVDSDNEPDLPDKHGHSLQSEVNPSMIPGVGFGETDAFIDDEDESASKANGPFTITPKRKRDLKVIDSDDEQEDHEVVPKRRAFRIDGSDNEGHDDDDDTLPIQRIFNRVKSKCRSNDDDDDNIPISQLKVNHAQVSSQPAGLHAGSSSGRRSGNLTDTLTRPRRRLVKCEQSERRDRAQELESSPDTLTNENVEDDELEEDDSASDASLGSFIVKDSDVEEVEDNLSEDSVDHFHEAEAASDDNLDYNEIISKFRSRRDPKSKWDFQGDMLSDFSNDPELCMRAVCALYRQQTTTEKLCKESIVQNGRGFSKFDAPRGTKLGEFLTGGDPNGDLVKFVEELRQHNPKGPEVCCELAKHYSNQLFEIYKNNEDPFFPSS